MANKKLFHNLLDLVLDKQDSEADAGIGDEAWAKTKDGKTEIVHDEDVLEALRNA